MSASEVTEIKKPGRPRDPTVDEKILHAAIELLAHDGYEATSIDAVASASGVSRSAIYRRFSNKTELIIHAANYVFTELSPPVRAATSPKDQVLALLENTVELLTKTPAGAVFRNLIPHLDSVPEFARNSNRLAGQRRDVLKKATLEAIEAGQLSKPKNVDLWLDRVMGAIYFRFLITGRTLQRKYIRSLIED